MLVLLFFWGCTIFTTLNWCSRLLQPLGETIARDVGDVEAEADDDGGGGPLRVWKWPGAMEKSPVGDGVSVSSGETGEESW